MDINQYLNIEWKPVNKLDFDLHPVSEGLYRFNPNWYLCAVPYDQNMEGDSEHVTQMIWAQSDGAAKRIWDMSIDSDEASEAQLPFVLSLGLSLPTYGNLLTALSTKYPGQTMESASYRIATDGKFVKKLSVQTTMNFTSGATKTTPLSYPLLHLIQTEQTVNKAIIGTLFTPLRFGVAAPLYPKAPLHKQCPIWRRYKA